MSLIENFSTLNFTYDGSTRKVYYRGSGPAVLIMHEIGGMTHRCLEFAERVEKAGFTVYLPLMFGKPDESSSLLSIGLNGALNTVRICLSKEFHCFEERKSSPITDWLRALCRHIHEQPEHRGYPGVGAIGMCLTGGFVLSLMIDESIMAPVMSQPGLPFAITEAYKFALGVSPEELEKAKERAEDVHILALRFTEDFICPAERFETLRQEFGNSVETIEIDSSKSNPDRIPGNAHSVLTEHFANCKGHPYHSTHKALERVLTFLQKQLKHLPQAG